MIMIIALGRTVTFKGTRFVPVPYIDKKNDALFSTNEDYTCKVSQ